MMSSYDREYVDRILREIDGDLAFARARWCVCHALGQLTTTGKPGRAWAPSRLVLVGLAREVDGRFMAHHAPRAGRKFTWWSESARSVTPIGWRWEIVCDRDAVLVVPAWLYYPRRWYRWARTWWWWRRYEARQ